MLHPFIFDILSPQAINIGFGACWCELRGGCFSKFCPAWYTEKYEVLGWEFDAGHEWVWYNGELIAWTINMANYTFQPWEYMF